MSEASEETGGVILAAYPHPAALRASTLPSGEG